MKNLLEPLNEIHVKSNQILTNIGQYNNVSLLTNGTPPASSVLMENGNKENRKRKSLQTYKQNNEQIDIFNENKTNLNELSNNNNSSFITERLSKKVRPEITPSSPTYNKNNKSMPIRSKKKRRIALGPSQLESSINVYLTKSAEKKKQQLTAKIIVSNVSAESSYMEEHLGKPYKQVKSCTRKAFSWLFLSNYLKLN